MNAAGEPLLGHLQRSLGLPEEQQGATQQDVERRDTELISRATGGRHHAAPRFRP
jgi:hypothetical protein